MKLVVDCSCVISSLMHDENSPEIDYSLYQLYAPTVFLLECSNAILCAHRRKRISKEVMQGYLQFLYEMSFTIDKLCTSQEHFHEVANLADKYNLTSYDASYIELARRIDAKIATFDKALIKAANDSGIEVLDIKKTA